MGNYRQVLLSLSVMGLIFFCGYSLKAQEDGGKKEKKAVATEPKPVTIVNENLEGGGHHIVRKGVSFKTDWDDPKKESFYGNGIYIEYSNKPCANPHWIQFMWIEATDSAGHPVTQGSSPLHHQNGADEPVTFSDPANPQWVVDSPSGNSAYYEDGGAHSEDNSAIYDAPSANLPESWPRPTPKGLNAKLVKHYRTFKICDGKPVHSWEWTATFTGGPGKMGPEYETKDRKDNDLDKGQKEAIEKYPQKTVFQ